ncbi:phosphatidylglycerophosphatase A, partial [Campylobacter coli]|nr:phosphatidylglycerophosphatase A [Campylobacter coli]
ANSLLNFFMAFVFFRIFDITKPSIIGKIDKKTKGGLGVMLDDMLAGLFAGLLSAVIYGFLLKFDLVFWDKDLINLF